MVTSKAWNDIALKGWPCHLVNGALLEGPCLVMQLRLSVCVHVFTVTVTVTVTSVTATVIVTFSVTVAWSRHGLGRHGRPERWVQLLGSFHFHRGPHSKQNC